MRRLLFFCRRRGRYGRMRPLTEPLGKGQRTGGDPFGGRRNGIHLPEKDHAVRRDKIIFPVVGAFHSLRPILRVPCRTGFLLLPDLCGGCFQYVAADGGVARKKRCQGDRETGGQIPGISPPQDQRPSAGELFTVGVQTPDPSLVAGDPMGESGGVAGKRRAVLQCPAAGSGRLGSQPVFTVVQIAPSLQLIETVAV